MILPDDLEVEQPSKGAFDFTDPFVMARYVNLVADGFDPRYMVYPAAHGQEDQKPPI